MFEVVKQVLGCFMNYQTAATLAISHMSVSIFGKKITGKGESD
jgi:hypothetical protein